MTVYVDDFLIQADVPNNGRIVRGKWSHMYADSREELEAFATRLGLKKEWIQYPDTWKEHFDVTAPKRALAIRLGAVKIGYASKESIELTNRKRAKYGLSLIPVPKPIPEPEAEPTLF